MPRVCIVYPNPGPSDRATNCVWVVMDWKEWHRIESIFHRDGQLGEDKLNELVRCISDRCTTGRCTGAEPDDPAASENVIYRVVLSSCFRGTDTQLSYPLLAPQ